jgi:hypothetical protein
MENHSISPKIYSELFHGEVSPKVPSVALIDMEVYTKKL